MSPDDVDSVFFKYHLISRETRLSEMLNDLLGRWRLWDNFFTEVTHLSLPVNSMSFIWNDNMREKREANANAT